MIETKDLKLTFAKSDLIWRGAPRPGLPILRWADRTICEPVLYYFGYSAEKKRVSIKSMHPEAFAIRSWIVYLLNRNLDIFDVNDLILEEYRTSLGWIEIPRKRSKRDRNIRLIQKKKNRIDTIIHKIFEFYRVIPDAMPFDEKGNRIPTFVGFNSGINVFPISCKSAFDRRRKRDVLRWDQSESENLAPVKPMVPTEQGVFKVLTYLRSHGLREQERRKLLCAPSLAFLLGERNWAMARTITGGGLRCEELSQLTVDALSDSLFRAGITDTAVDLDLIAHQPTEQRKIISRILSLRDATEYAAIDVFVTGKGAKSRYAPFMITEYVDILEVAVWGYRRQVIELYAKTTNAPIDRYVFISTETWSALDPGSIGDIIGDAFRKTGVKGSAHKLRAFYATVTAAALWREYFALNQYRFDSILVKNCLRRLATAMGHSSPDTTIEFYLGESLFRHLTRLPTPAAKLFREMWDIFVMKNVAISPRKADVMLKLSNLISSAEDDSKLMAVLEHITEDDRFRAIPKTAVVRPKLVHSSDGRNSNSRS